MDIFSACLGMRRVKTYTLAHIPKGPQTSTVCMDVSKYSQSVVVLKKERKYTSRDCLLANSYWLLKTLSICGSRICRF